jgi:uncharacterized membrane protein
MANTMVGIFAGLPFLAPVLMANNLRGPASFIYQLYSFTCHQLPYRSWFLLGRQPAYSAEEFIALGYPSAARVLPSNPLTGSNPFWGNETIGWKVAWCERDTAIYLTIFLAGLAFAAMRPRVKIRPLSLWGFILLCIPIAIDGITQLPGWRESTPLLRTLTGGLFGLGMVWLVYPYIDQGMREASRAMTVLQTDHIASP